MFVIVENNQSIWDIAMQVYGDYSGVEQLMKDNPETVNFFSGLIAGTRLVVTGKVINEQFVDYFEKAGYKPATGLEKSAGGAFSSGFSSGFNV